MTDLDTLATALYVRTDDLLKESPARAPWRPVAGIGPQASDAELIAVLARDTSLWSDDVWVADSTPVECGPFPGDGPPL